MNIQGGLSRDYIRKCMGRFITQNCKLLILYTTTILLFGSSGITILNIDSFHHSLTGWYVLHYFVSILDWLFKN